MIKRTIVAPSKNLVGISCRTSNAREMDPDTARIAATIKKYLKNNFGEKTKHRTSPGTMLCVYTEYERDEHAPYTYFVGEEVSELEAVSEGLEVLHIPEQKYVVFEVGPGKMPQLCIDAWMSIWDMSEDELGGSRAYKADFELYDERRSDPNNTTFDIYIGIQ